MASLPFVKVFRWLLLPQFAGCPTPADPSEQNDDNDDDDATGEPSETTGGATTVDPTTGGPPQDEVACDDAVDEDGDGVTDCYDADCWEEAVCTDRFVRVATWNVRNVGGIGESPLRCGTNGDTSDHRPVVAVFYF